MAIGCSPDTHPTKQWIEDNIDDYADDDNPDTAVSGLAFYSWTGPRCTEVASASGSDSDDDLYGPPMYVSILIAAAVIAVTLCVIAYQLTQRKKNQARLRENAVKMELQKDLGAASFSSTGEVTTAKAGKEAPYRANFV
ncbi:beta-glucan synthesis-associated protein [Phytophthora ramorum]